MALRIKKSVLIYHAAGLTPCPVCSNINFMSDRVRQTIQLILRECFWGDYRMSADEVESRILAKDDTYCKYLVQRIIDNSPFPSARLIALFDLDYLDRLINGMIISGRMKDRLRLVRSVLFREPREGIRPWIIQ